MTFSEHLREQFQTDPQLATEWRAMRPLLRIIRMMVLARSKYGWTQGDLARRMGVSRSKIKRVEAGNDVITDTFVAKFLALFADEDGVADQSGTDGVCVVPAE